MLSTIVYCIVGCNTGAPDQQALHVLECDTETGDAKIVQSVKGLQGTTYFALDKARENLYTMIAENGHGALARFDLSCPGREHASGPILGAMTKLADLPCEAPCHITLSPDEKTLAFAAYSSGTWGTYDLATHTLLTAVLPDDGIGPRADRQKKAYAHQAFYLSDGKTLGICNLGCDRIHFFNGGAEVGCLKTEAGDGPRHAILSHDGSLLFVVNELSSSVTNYQSSRTGEISRTKVGKWSMLPADCPLKPTETKAAAIKLTADGKILMASNRGDDSIAFFEVNDDGSLTLKNVAKLTGRFPRDFELMPGERFMVVGHKMSDEIQVYAFDRAACTLTPVGKPIAAWRPLCFKFL